MSEVRAALVLGLIAGCCACEQPYSNEDLRFMRSLPTVADVTIAVPAVEPAPESEIATFYLRARESSAALNDVIFSPIRIVEAVTQGPPSYRDADLRGWGPFSEGDAQYVLYVSRTATSAARPLTSTTTLVPVSERFDYILYGQGGSAVDLVPIFSGSFAPVGPGGQGIGTMFIDLETSRAVNGKGPDRGWYSGGYDTRDGRLDLVLGVAMPEDLGGAADRLSGYYRFGQSEAGTDFTLSYLQDLQAMVGLPPSSALEVVSMRARWRPDQRGRADVYIGQGDLPIDVTAVECWDERFRRVFFFSTGDQLGPSSGSVEACAPDLRRPPD
ncbi:MAG: hypothetical protein IT384_17665 [Deltaproteobacteria bacterium]|nr:hypothetical protein [Deltaproteobacteria bacterium]